jgi:hypothetical protein
VAHEYGWSEETIWWEIPFHRLILYVRRIEERKLAEFGTSQDRPIDTAILELLETIEVVKAEKRNGKERSSMVNRG